MSLIHLSMRMNQTIYTRLRRACLNRHSRNERFIWNKLFAENHLESGAHISISECSFTYTVIICICLREDEGICISSHIYHTFAICDAIGKGTYEIVASGGECTNRDFYSTALFYNSKI